MGRDETGIDLVAPSDLQAIYRAAVARRENLPVSFVVGAHPIDLVAATMRLPGDELSLVASLRDAPLPVVKCITNDIQVPADAEWILEGYLDPRGYVEAEGPYGEFLGYYGGVKRNPMFHCTAITRRRDAIFQTATISGRHMTMHGNGTVEFAADGIAGVARAGNRHPGAGGDFRQSREQRHVPCAHGHASAGARRSAQRDLAAMGMPC